MPGFQSFCPSFANVFKGLISVFPPGLILGNTFVLFELMCIFQKVTNGNCCAIIQLLCYIFKYMHIY